jgi:LPS export ABC transporter protein LptC
MAGFQPGCGDLADKPATSGGNDRPRQAAKRIEMTETHMGVRRWTLQADQVASYSGRSTTHAENVHVDFFDDDGAPASVLTSRTGRIDRATNDMVAVGDVVVTNVQGYVLETDSLRWSNAERLIRTEAFVRMTRGDDVLTGYGLVSDPEMDRFEILERVSGRSRGREEPVAGERSQP